LYKDRKAPLGPVRPSRFARPSDKAMLAWTIESVWRRDLGRIQYLSRTAVSNVLLAWVRFVHIPVNKHLGLRSKVVSRPTPSPRNLRRP